MNRTSGPNQHTCARFRPFATHSCGILVAAESALAEYSLAWDKGMAWSQLPISHGVFAITVRVFLFGETPPAGTPRETIPQDHPEQSPVRAVGKIREPTSELTMPPMTNATKHIGTESGRLNCWMGLGIYGGNDTFFNSRAEGIVQVRILREDCESVPVVGSTYRRLHLAFKAYKHRSASLYLELRTAPKRRSGKQRIHLGV